MWTPCRWMPIELFTADSVNLEDIRIFKGGRIDRAILYAASILNHSCETLRGLFRQIIEDRTEILYPVKDLEVHHGLGFAAWCDNNRVLIGNRLYMEREGVPLPEQEYEDELYHGYTEAFGMASCAVSRMKAHWFYLIHLFDGADALEKPLRKAREGWEYETVVNQIFACWPK